MKSISALAFVVAVIISTFARGPGLTAPVRTENGWLITSDFHVHAFPGDGMLTPPQLRREAARRNLHVIAITNHNQMLAARVPARVTPDNSLPIVLYGEEVTTVPAHIAAARLARPVSWRLPTDAIVDSIHAAGGIAILAHPDTVSWRMLDSTAMASFDGIEVANGPTFEAAESEAIPIYHAVRSQRTLAAIGSSDFHFAVPIGEQRTVLLVSALTEDAVLDAVRSGHTAVRFDEGWVGDSTVIGLARAHAARLMGPARFPTVLQGLAAGLAWLALLGLVLSSGSRRPT